MSNKSCKFNLLMRRKEKLNENKNPPNISVENKNDTVNSYSYSSNFNKDIKMIYEK